MENLQTKYLERLSELYPTIAAASTEAINLEAILNLPKGTEHFLTDIHGEYEAFSHVLKNGSGSVRRKVGDVFGNTLSSEDKRSLATLIYYPREKMAQILERTSNKEDWYKITLYRLIEVAKCAGSKYTRSKVRKALPPEFAYIIEELMTEKMDVRDKESYYNSIVRAIIRQGRAQYFIVALCELIQRLVVDHLHIVGDIYDRGPGPHIIMDKLMTYHSLDIPTDRERGKNLMWYIWLHENSPLFGKNKMATFERYFLAEKETHKEKKNPYYQLLEQDETVNNILREFGLSGEGSHIINGHVPVKLKDGENPVKCGGKVLVIDGGFSRAYQKETGIAGYTLIYNSYGLILASHEPFESTESAIANESDIHSEIIVVKRVSQRKLVGDTDTGKQIKAKIRDLEMLLEAYRTGSIAEKYPASAGLSR